MKYFNALKETKEEVEAIQYTVENLNDVIDFVGVDKVKWSCATEELWVTTHIGDLLVRKGHYIVKKQNVGVFPLAHRLFHMLYSKSEVEISVEPIETAQ